MNHTDDIVEINMREFVSDCQTILDDNSIVAFQFLSIDRVNGQTMQWHLLSRCEEGYISASNEFIYATPTGLSKDLQRTLFLFDYPTNYWYESLGDRRITARSSRYKYVVRNIEENLTADFEQAPPPGQDSASLEVLLSFWKSCLQRYFDDSGAAMWVSQEHDVQSLGRVKSHGLCLFDAKIDDSEVRAKISRKIRDFIIDHNLSLYVQPKIEEIEELKKKVRRTDEIFKDLIEQAPDHYLEPRLLEQIQFAQRALEYYPVLISGATGTGKEKVAELINSAAGRNFLPINSAEYLLDDELSRSELFGYTPGSFTGGNADGKTGYLEEYSDGTIFFDEIQQMPVKIQMQLKRVLQDGVYRPVGSTSTRRTNAHFVFATNKNLRDLVDKEFFLEDFYFRISLIPVQLRTLHELMVEDMYHFEQALGKVVSKLSRTHGDKSLTPAAKKKLAGYTFPGNFRELYSIMVGAFLRSGADTIDADHIFLENLSAGSNKVVRPIRLKPHPEIASDAKIMIVLNQLAEAADKLAAKKHRITGAALNRTAREIFDAEYRYKSSQALKNLLRKNKKHQKAIIGLCEVNAEALRNLLSCTELFDPETLMTIRSK